MGRYKKQAQLPEELGATVYLPAAPLACAIIPQRRTKNEPDRMPSIVARRPQPPAAMLSRKDLAKLQPRLSMMSVTAVEDFYQYTHSACRIYPGHFPSARAIQELVQGWKQMRKWR